MIKYFRPGGEGPAGSFHPQVLSGRVIWPSPSASMMETAAPISWKLHLHAFHAGSAFYGCHKFT